MEILDYSSNVTSLSTSYQGDTDVKFIGNVDNAEEGFSFIKENYLKAGIDRKINNYSSLYLTNKQKLTDIIKLDELEHDYSVKKFNSSIIDNNGLYLTISSTNSYQVSPFFTEKDEKFVDPLDRIFEITVFDDSNIKISHKNKNGYMYYMSVLNVSTIQFTKIDNTDYTTLESVIDYENNKLSLFKTISGVKYLIYPYNSSLLTTNLLSAYVNNYFNINYYIQKLSPKLNTSWVSYNSHHINEYEVNSLKSINNLKNNFLVNTQYSYITGNTINANILTLKNQKTNKNYSYRSDYMEINNRDVPTVDNRTYTGLFTGNEQEKGDYGITLNYEFYNADYKMKSDQYTIFYTPESLYPYKQININDLQWNYRGALAGENPYMSDKIFKNKMDYIPAIGEYLCSWLYKRKNGESIWLDRYYNPEKTSYSNALASTFTLNYSEPINELLKTKLLSSEYYDVLDIYNTLEEEELVTPQTPKSALYGISYFDKKSDLTILPNTEYIYHRIGNSYVSEVLNAMNEFLIQNGLTLLNGNTDSKVYITQDVDEVEYEMNGNAYALMDNYAEINNTHQFTMAFWLQSDDWSKRFGYQIVGNLNDKGFALLDDRKVTPLITIQNGKNLFVYNTNFEFLDVGSLQNEALNTTSIIKDLYRTDHLDSFYTINIE